MTSRVSKTTGTRESVKSPTALFTLTFHFYSNKKPFHVIPDLLKYRTSKEDVAKCRLKELIGFVSPIHLSLSPLALFFWSHVGGRRLLQETNILAQTKFRPCYVPFSFPRGRRKGEKRKISRFYTGYVVDVKVIFCRRTAFSL